MITCLLLTFGVQSTCPFAYSAAASLLENSLNLDPGILFINVRASFLLSNTLSSVNKMANVLLPPEYANYTNMLSEV